MHGGSRLLGDIPVTGWRQPEVVIALTVALTRLQDRLLGTRMFPRLDVAFCNVR